MTKQKTNKAISKRFRVTKSGKMLRRHQNSRHLRSNKSKKQIRRYRAVSKVHPAFAKKFKKLIAV